jgi:hypothetical protein
MDSQASEINARLERLERENRRMKKIGIVAIVFASVLFVSGQAKTNKVVEANAFRLVEAGKVRAELSMPSPGEPELIFYDNSGTSVAYISTTPPGLYLGKSGTKESAIIHAGTSDTTIPTQPVLFLGGSASNVLLAGGTSNSIRMFGSAGTFKVNVDEDGPNVTVTDNEGYSTEVGKTDLVLTRTGKKEQTPAASLVLFDKDKKVLWSAP